MDVDQSGDHGGKKARPFHGMNIDDVLNYFNMDSEDHDGPSDPLNPNAENVDPSFDDVSFGWFLNDGPGPGSTGGQPDDEDNAENSQDTQDTADGEESAPPRQTYNLPCPRFINKNNHCWYISFLGALLYFLKRCHAAEPRGVLPIDREWVKELWRLNSITSDFVISPFASLKAFVRRFDLPKNLLTHQQPCLEAFTPMTDIPFVANLMVPTQITMRYKSPCECQNRGAVLQTGNEPNSVFHIPWKKNLKLSEGIKEYFTRKEVEMKEGEELKCQEICGGDLEWMEEEHYLHNFTQGIVFHVNRTQHPSPIKLSGPIDLTGAHQVTIQGEGNRTANYELIAVVEHIGRMITSGHYVCHILTGPETAYTLDDALDHAPSNLDRLSNGILFVYKLL